MSSFRKQTKNPKTGEWEEAFWIDDALGKHHYGVLFPSETGTKAWKNLDLHGVEYIDPRIETLETR